MLRGVTDEVFFTPGVNRGQVFSLFTPASPFPLYSALRIFFQNRSHRVINSGRSPAKYYRA